MSVMMFIFGVIGMTTFGLVIVATIVQAVNFFLMTATRVEIRTRKRLKRVHTDHYAALLENALYGKVLTGGNPSCNYYDGCPHPRVEDLTEETGKLPIPSGYPHSPYDVVAPPGKSMSAAVEYLERPVPFAAGICDICNGHNHHWSWCTSVEAIDERRAAKPRYTWISPEQRAVNLAEQKEADKKRAKVHTPDGITDIGDHWNCWLCDHPEEP